MGTLKYAILGLLNKKSMTGYELTKEFETTLFEFWNAKHSQIYPELRALTETGLVEYKIEISGSVLEKKVYSITKSGKDEFIKWVNRRQKIKTMPKDEFRLQLYFSGCIDRNERLSLLNDMLKQHKERLKELGEISKKFEPSPPEDEEMFCTYMVFLGAVAREKAQCHWLEKCISLCSKRQ